MFNGTNLNELFLLEEEKDNSFGRNNWEQGKPQVLIVILMIIHLSVLKQSYYIGKYIKI
jgi:hypothetical protein